MLIRGMAASIALLALTPAAAAGSRLGFLHRVSCSVIRHYVAKYSAPTAEMWARSHGATDADIEAARLCLKNPLAKAMPASHVTSQ